METRASRSFPHLLCTYMYVFLRKFQKNKFPAIRLGTNMDIFNIMYTCVRIYIYGDVMLYTYSWNGRRLRGSPGDDHEIHSFS